MSDRCPTRSDWAAFRPLRPRDPSECKAEWGPISSDLAERIGAPAPLRSVLVRPPTPDVERVVEQALDEVPPDVYPVAGETAAELAQRLGQSKWLDDLRAKKGGCHKQRVRVNETKYPQPRRKTWSILLNDCSAVGGTGVGRDSTGHHAHPATGRWLLALRSPPKAAESCEPMPSSVFALGVVLWRAAAAHLSEASRATPPNHCQLMLYYTLFKSDIKPHRDFYAGTTGSHYLEEQRKHPDVPLPPPCRYGPMHCSMCGH